MEDLIKALTIFLKYGNEYFPTHCEHDVMQVNIQYSIVSDEDKKELDRLGFFEDSEDGTFMSYRFGKC